MRNVGLFFQIVMQFPFISVHFVIFYTEKVFIFEMEAFFYKIEAFNFRFNSSFEIRAI